MQSLHNNFSVYVAPTTNTKWTPVNGKISGDCKYLITKMKVTYKGKT